MELWSLWSPFHFSKRNGLNSQMTLASREITITELLYSDKQNVCTTYTVVVYCINVLIKHLKKTSWMCSLLIQNHYQSPESLYVSACPTHHCSYSCVVAGHFFWPVSSTIWQVAIWSLGNVYSSLNISFRHVETWLELPSLPVATSKLLCEIALLLYACINRTFAATKYI